MLETPKRLTAEYRAILPPDEAFAVDTRRVVAHALGTGEYEKLDLTRNDSSEFESVVRERVEKVGKIDPRKHILFENLPPEAMFSSLSEEVFHWNIRSKRPLDPKAAQAIIDLYEDLENLPPEIHKLHFPLFMVGYHIGHAARTAIYNTLVAQEVNDDGFDYKFDLVRVALEGFLHDLGKLREDQKILAKKDGELSPSEFERIKEHPIVGAVAIGSLLRYKKGIHWPADLNHFNGIWSTALLHHVRPDNHPKRSYPQDIKSERLIPEIQLTTLSDSFDAMTSGRPYRMKPTEQVIKNAFGEIKRFKGKQFDPDLAELFCKLRPIPEML